jgi:RHS repeat-associated protein
LTTYLYDNRDRLWKKTVDKNTVHERVLTYLYDDNNNIKTISSSTGETVLDYQYDELNRLTAANGTTYSYDPAGNLSTTVYPTPNGVRTSYYYNDANRLTFMTVKNSSDQLLASFEYDDYDQTDSLTWQPERRLTRTGQRQGAAELLNYDSHTQRRIVAYDYDPLRRLRAERIRSLTDAGWPSWPLPDLPGTPSTGDLLYDTTPGYSDLPSHGYDLAGNRTSRSVTDPDLIARGAANYSSQSFDADDRLTGGINQHDANGNTRVGELLPLTGVISPSDTYKDEYDYENRLIRRSNASTTIKLVYDADGNRVRKTIISGTTTEIRYLVDQLNPTAYAQVLEEWKSINGAGATLRNAYVYGHHLISQRPAANPIYYGYDGHGNVRVLLSQNGTVTDTYSYDAFGILIEQAPTVPAQQTENSYLYCGEQWDRDLGLYFLRARYFNPAKGRFWTMDSQEGSQEDPLSLHKYTYAQCDPVNFSDPSGNFRKGHHKIPKSIWKPRGKPWKKTSPWNKDARNFFDSPGAMVDPDHGHDFSSHSAYNSQVQDLIDMFFHLNPSISPGNITTAECKDLLDFVEKDPFVWEFNTKVPNGRGAVVEFVKDRGYKLLPSHLRGRALKSAVGLWEKWGKRLIQKGPGVGLTLGFLAVQANQMAHAGYTKGQIAEELTYSFYDDLSMGSLDYLNKGCDKAIVKVEDFAEDAFNRTFGQYADLDPETSEFDGRLSTRATIGDHQFDRKWESGETFKAGDSVGGLFDNW